MDGVIDSISKIIEIFGLQGQFGGVAEIPASEGLARVSITMRDSMEKMHSNEV